MIKMKLKIKEKSTLVFKNKEYEEVISPRMSDLKVICDKGNLIARVIAQGTGNPGDPHSYYSIGEVVRVLDLRITTVYCMSSIGLSQEMNKKRLNFYKLKE